MSGDFNQPPNAPAAAPRRNMVAAVAFLSALLGFCIPAVPSFVALFLGILLPIVVGIPAIRRQEETRVP